jgi:hypothetical protein
MAAKLMEMTFRECFPDYRFPIWKISVPDWIDGMRAYRNRDFDSQEIVHPPKPSPTDVRDWFREFHDRQREYGCNLTCGDDFPPVLFLDELDKFSATEHTTRWLFNLLNAVMASGGAVISTTNMTPVELKKHLGEPLYRRVVESAVDGEERVRVLSYPPKSKR